MHKAIPIPVAALALAIACTDVARADAPAPAAARKLTFEDAIALATAQSPDVAIAAENAEIADSKVGGLETHRLPVLSVNADARRFTKEYDINLMGASIKAYDPLQSNVTASLSEPLTGQALLSILTGAAEHGADAAHADVDKARLDAAFHAADGYVRVLEARAAAEVAHKTVAQIEGELERAQMLRAADTYNDIDVLRFKSAKAVADQAAVHADAAADAATAGFVVALGLHDGDPVEVVDDLPAEAPPLALSVAQAQDRALGARPELHAARARIDAADGNRRAAYAGYFPDVRAQAVYMHNTGVAPFQPDNAAFVGLTLSWNVWDWGTTGHGVTEAEHGERAAQVAADQLVDQVRLDVRRHWLDARAARDSLASVATQLETAEEAYRLQQVRFDAGAATTTDVLDAETDVARARLASANARYDYLLSLVALARSIGDLPAGTTGAQGSR